jgi:catalase
LYAFAANFQRDGRAVHDDNQGSRPNYPSTQQTLGLPPRAYNDANHTVWVWFYVEITNN